MISQRARRCTSAPFATSTSELAPFRTNARIGVPGCTAYSERSPRIASIAPRTISNDAPDSARAPARAAGHEAPQGKPVLELNPGHPLVQRLGADDAHLADWANVLFDQALLAEGAPLPDPAAFVRSMNALMVDLAQSPKEGA